MFDEPFLTAGLGGAAILQAVVALLNLQLARWLGWKPELARLPPLVRQVFHVHSWFLSLTLAIFAVLTWRFATEMAEGHQPIATWLATAIGVFWLVRTVIQLAYYSPGHWRGRRGPTITHIALFVTYGTMSALYLGCGIPHM
ncbi:MAG: hypothetical protein ACYSTY_07155 [Planctomycetota bacterium]|jgi:hypothetical protein